MSSNGGARAAGGWFGVAVALVVSTWIASRAWERVKLQPPDRTIQVTGSAKRRIVSDQVEWTAQVSTQDLDRTKAYRDLHGHVETTLAYLRGLGLKPSELRVGSATVEKVLDTEYVGTGEARVERQILRGYAARQAITVNSGNVPLVERASREVTQLLERGVPVSSSAPSYYYTKLGELKIAMLAEASSDARTRAEQVVTRAGGAGLGELRGADMGVINVNPANSTSTSWQGNNDTSSLEKDILTIIHATFALR
ncbi:MAG: SIMPL domain-containing protein [Proteobacteria bacterium]|nr:SIMPL domain-containing protein [Pseudomonadota bacterium]